MRNECGPHTGPEVTENPTVAKEKKASRRVAHAQAMRADGPARTCTVNAALRLRNAREHRALERLFWSVNQVHNALVEQELGIRRVNRQRILKHPEGWEPEQFVDADWNKASETPEALVKRPRKYDLGKQWTSVTAQDLPRIPKHCQGSERLEPATLGRRIVTSVFDDYTRRYERPNVPAPRFRPRRKLRSVAIQEANVSFDGHRDLTIKIQGTPKLRARLQRTLPAECFAASSSRVVRTRDGMAGVGPARYELRITIETPTMKPAPSGETKTVITGWDPGGRAALTNDAGETVNVGKRRYLRRMQRACARTRKGSKGRRKAYARVGRMQSKETTARNAHRHKQVAHAARKAHLHVVEKNTHAGMRRKGGKRKRGMNRQLAFAAPAKSVALLKQQCDRQGKTWVEVDPCYNTRQCMHCASRDTKVTRTKVRGNHCGEVTPRDVNAAANAVLKHLARNGGVASPGICNREVSVRRRSALAARCPVIPESLGLVERALASWGPSKSTSQKQSMGP